MLNGSGSGQLPIRECDALDPGALEHETPRRQTRSTDYTTHWLPKCQAPPRPSRLQECRAPPGRLYRQRAPRPDVALERAGKKPRAGRSPVLRERLTRSSRACRCSRFRRLPTPPPVMPDPALPVRRPTYLPRHRSARPPRRPAPAPPPGVRPMNHPRPLPPEQRPRATSACHGIHTCPVSVRFAIRPGSRTA